MAPSGRPPKPIEQHKRHGTFNATRHAGKADLALVEPVGVLDDFDPAVVFDQVMAQGVGWLARTDAVALAMLRELLRERSELRPIASGSMEARRALRELDKLIVSMLGQLGFDPASRTRVGLAEVKTMSKLEQMQAARDNRT
jgi:hypothetical protein